MAYSFYLEGRYHWNKRTEDELQKSVACFEDAIERDPAYAEAHAGIADAYVTLGTYGALPPADVLPSAKAALEKLWGSILARRGLHVPRLVRSVFDWSWAEAERDFLRAIALNPSTRPRITGTRSTISSRGAASRTRARSCSGRWKSIRWHSPSGRVWA